MQAHISKRRFNQAFVYFTKIFTLSAHCAEALEGAATFIVQATKTEEKEYEHLFACFGKPQIL